MSEQTLRIVIVGGVAGGASAATRARRMNEGAQIIMLEKDRHVSFAGGYGFSDHSPAQFNPARLAVSSIFLMKF